MKAIRKGQLSFQKWYFDLSRPRAITSLFTARDNNKIASLPVQFF